LVLKGGRRGRVVENASPFGFAFGGKRIVEGMVRKRLLCNQRKKKVQSVSFGWGREQPGNEH